MTTSTISPASAGWRLSHTGVPRLVVPKKRFFSLSKALWFSHVSLYRFFAPTFCAISVSVMVVWIPSAGMSMVFLDPAAAF